MIPPAPQRRRIPAFLSFIVLLLACAGILHGQAPAPVLDPMTSGRRFLIAFPDTTANALDSRYPNTRVRTEATIWIFSAVKNKVKITNAAGGVQILNLEEGKFQIHTLTGSNVADVINTPIAKSIRVEADFPIVIYCYWANVQGLEAWTPIPVEAWGKRYHVATVAGEVVEEIGIAGETEIPSTSKGAPAEIVIIAAYDSTRVTIKPRAGIGLLGNPALSVVLNEGEVYQVQSFVDARFEWAGRAQQDIGATVIESDKPVGVISGNTRAMINKDDMGLKNNAYKNMLMEWLAPDEQHGREFVFMPTWDGQRPGSGQQFERKREFVRVYNTRSPGADTMARGYHLQPGGTVKIDFQIRRDSLQEFAIGAPNAVYFKTESPAQAMMHSSAIVKFNGSTPCFRGIPCLSYDAWAPYMVEMVPREQWTTFAPYYAPTQPGGMNHYINVVTDTASAGKIYRENGSLFLFNRRIWGTDLIWGSMSVSQGEDHWLAGKDGARFYAFAYGTFKGYEEYRPGRTVKKDEEHAVASGGNQGAVSALHPCEYEEYNALAYGYPLAPSRRVLKPGDSLRIETEGDCSRMRVKVTTVNADPTGLRSVELESPAVNTRLIPVDPSKLSDINERTQVEVEMAPIDYKRNASATLLITDRTGKVSRVDFTYTREMVNSHPAVVDFGAVLVNTDSTRSVTITNTMDRGIEVKDVRLVDGAQGYTIVSTDPAGPALVPPQPVTIAPGASMEIVVRTRPASGDRTFVDTLVVNFPCTRHTFPLITGAVLSGVDKGGEELVDQPGAILLGDMVEIRYALAHRERVRIEIYDPLGRRVDLIADDDVAAGEHTVRWDASGVASGVYYCRIVAGRSSRTIPLMIPH